MDNSYIKSLQKKPSYSQYKGYHWADYLELLCLANLDGEFSKIDTLDRLSEREDDLEEGTPEDIEEMDALDEEGFAAPSQRYKRYDHWINRIDQWFEVLKSRELRYKDNYPFTVIDNDLVLEYDENNINHKYYLFLLICSKLYLLDNATSAKFSSYYEVMSYDGLRQLLPTSFDVELFGTNELNENALFGKGVTCLDKIKNLALVLNEDTSKSFKEESYPPNNFGDEGLDLLAYSETGDDLSSKIVILGQCACTEDWISKQSSSSFESWSNKIDFTTMTINAVFIPFCFRDAVGDWFDRGKIRKSFVVDRFRLIHYLAENHNFNAEIERLIGDIILNKESVV